MTSTSIGLDDACDEIADVSRTCERGHRLRMGSSGGLVDQMKVDAAGPNSYTFRLSDQSRDHHG